MNLMSRSLQNLLTNFLTLCWVAMEKGPIYGKINNCPHEQHSERKHVLSLSETCFVFIKNKIQKHFLLHATTKP